MDAIENKDRIDTEGVFSKVLRAGRRTYFFDVRETRAGDYYLTITESKKNIQPNGDVFYKKHKIYLYKEDFNSFKEMLNDTTDFVFKHKGEEVISERHQKHFNPKNHEFVNNNESSNDNKENCTISNSDSPSDLNQSSFTDLNFEDI